jgi:hypothetical protein
MWPTPLWSKLPSGGLGSWHHSPRLDFASLNSAPIRWKEVSSPWGSVTNLQQQQQQQQQQRRQAQGTMHTCQWASRGRWAGQNAMTRHGHAAGV